MTSAEIQRVVAALPVHLQEEMGRAGLDAVLVYGDEYRKENLRYVCNFWLGGDPYKPSLMGDLSELVIYPEVKSATEIKEIYESY